jgi:arginine/lysine/histidine transport system permease protein
VVFHFEYSSKGLENRQKAFGRLIIITVILFLVSFQVGAQDLGETPENTGWDLQESLTDKNLFSIAHVDINNIWAVGEDGVILQTTDGGITWLDMDTTFTNTWYDITTYDDSIFIVGTEGKIITKSLSDEIWTDISIPNNNRLNAISVVGNENVTEIYVASQNGDIWKSIDIGTTWSQLISTTNKPIYDIEFFDTTMGFAVGAEGLLLGTIDGGITWDERDIPVIYSSYNLYGIVFASPIRAYVVGDNGLFLRSTIGDNQIVGFIWTAWQTNIEETLYSVDASSINRVWAVGEKGTIIQTRDGGNTFSKQIVSSDINETTFYAIDVIDGDYSFVSGENGVILNTDRGGVTPGEGRQIRDYSDFSVYLDYALPVLVRGFFGMLQVIFLSLILGFILGIIFALFKTSNIFFFKTFGTIYTDFFRNTPLLVQILLIHFGLIEIGIDLTLGGNFQRAVISSILSLGLNSGAYQAEIIRSGILAIPTGQMEAGRSLGLTYTQTMRYIILPQAVRIVIPPLGNEFVNLTLNSSLASATGLFELVRGGRLIISTTFLTFQTWILVALFYFVVTYALTFVLRYLENKTKIPGLGLGEK